MLQALELNGFKSFADRTRFDFPPGTTVVVGPNGSGKSNVVDAVKWVLGAQSVKSLRGKEMTDVIFSGSKNRRQAGAAEVALIFDNSSRRLDFDEDQVQVARRVLRSGESEYLINRQPCRLRDIQDLLAKVGVASGSYSIIEQGKVDAVLQATPQERRAVFEEAAGISRFRAKRKETERRLQRIEQNLLRLSDIVEEVESRLKTVRSQAGKAQKYNELSERLKTLRIGVAADQWRKIETQIKQLSARLAAEERGQGELQSQLDDCEMRLQRAESADREAQHRLRQLVDRDAAVRERIAKYESQRANHLSRLDDLEKETQRLARQALLLASRADDSDRQLRDVDGQLEVCLEEHNRLEQEVQVRSEEFDQSRQRLVRCGDDHQRASKQISDEQRKLSDLQNKLAVTSTQLEALHKTLAQRRQEAEPLRADHDRLAAESARLNVELAASESALAKGDQEVDGLRAQLSSARQALQKTQTQLAETQGQLSGAQERIIVLEELEHRLGGLNAGARDVLRRAQEDPNGPFAGVRGVVADLFHVDADTAPLIEIALGEYASHVVLSSTGSLVESLAELSDQWRSRTSFLRLDVPTPASAVDRVDLTDQPGVMGRADAFVETEPDLAPLARRLLGRFWLVDTLARALRLSIDSGRGLNFVTLAGELVTAAGVLAVGPPQSRRGLLSRRSELATLKEHAEELERETVRLRSEASGTELQIADLEGRGQAASQRREAQSRTHGELALKAANALEKLQLAQQRLVAVEQQLDEADAASRDAQAEIDDCNNQIDEIQQAQTALQSAADEALRERQRLEVKIQSLRQGNTEARIDLARCEQRRASLKLQVEQLADERRERRQQLEETQARRNTDRAQQTEAATSALALSAELAELYRSKDRAAQELAALDEERRNVQREYKVQQRAAEELRKRVAKQQQATQSLNMELLQLRQRQEAAVERIGADYQIRLATLAMQTAVDEDFDETSAEEEISQLRQQLQDSGSVNLGALDELQSLQKRHETLHAQYDDMQAARARLEKISSEMNARCGDLYLETIDNVRRRFQEIFRALFGGGEADIVLESEDLDDSLEAGVSVVARPPGKQPRNISLLSGGEKTLTCVALLLAIFRNRPSPFCVLDEVDAALDETNIDRFLKVLQDFMGSTQFIVVTHSKRTMTCADTLYGVTMQESGVSKRVSVRFEDVGENSEINISSADGAQRVDGSTAQARAA